MSDSWIILQIHLSDVRDLANRYIDPHWQAVVYMLMGIEYPSDVPHDIHPLTKCLILHLGIQTIPGLKFSPGQSWEH